MVKPLYNPPKAWQQFVCCKCNYQNVFEANFCGKCGNNLECMLTQNKEAEQIPAQSTIHVLEKLMVPEPAPFLKPVFEPRLNKIANNFSCCYLYESEKFNRGNIRLQINFLRFKSRCRCIRITIPISLVDDKKYKFWYGAGLIIISCKGTSFSFSFFQEDAKSIFKILTASKLLTS